MRFFAITFLLLTISFYPAWCANNDPLNPKANVYVGGNINADTIDVEGEQSVISCTTFTAGSITSNTIETTELGMNTINVGSIISPNGKPVEIQGQLHIEGTMTYANSNPSLLKNAKSASSFIVIDDVLINGVIQWKAIHHECFDGEADGWAVKKIQSPTLETAVKLNLLAQNQHQDKMLAGSGGEIITKTFTELGTHSDMMIEAQFHFLSPFWRGQAAYMKIDNQLVWLDHHDWSEYDTINPCELDLENLEDYKITVPINVIVKHYSSDVTIEFGTTKSAEDFSECKNELSQNVHIFSIDDFVLNVK